MRRRAVLYVACLLQLATCCTRRGSDFFVAAQCTGALEVQALGFDAPADVVALYSCCFTPPLRRKIPARKAKKAGDPPQGWLLTWRACQKPRTTCSGQPNSLDAAHLAVLARRNWQLTSPSVLCCVNSGVRTLRGLTSLHNITSKPLHRAPEEDILLFSYENSHSLPSGAPRACAALNGAFKVSPERRRGVPAALHGSLKTQAQARPPPTEASLN